MTQTTVQARISVSQMNEFQKCNYSWFLKYRLGLRQRREDVAPATLGSAVHVGLEAAMRALAEVQGSLRVTPGYLTVFADKAIDAWDKAKRPDDKTVVRADGMRLVVERDEAFYDDWQDLIATAKGLVYRTLQDLDPDRYVVVCLDGEPLIEYDIVVPIDGTQFVFAGKADVVLRDKLTGMVEVIDWKVRRSLAALESEQLNAQIGLYQHALRLLGVEAHMGTVYQIKNHLPKQPKLNKDDTMSRANISSDWPTYRDALVAAGLDPNDYLDMRDKLADKEFFRPLRVVRTEDTTAALWQNLVAYAEIIEGADEFPRSYGYPCKSCVFAAWCSAELYGYDTDALLDDHYELIGSESEEEVDDDEDGSDT